jgi:hypothetical protein
MPCDVPGLELWCRGNSHVRLSFFWSGDRYAHRLEWVDEGSRVVCLESLEGADYQFWPPSPALQQLNVQSEVSGKQCALLLGMAGKSHWSASIEVSGSTLIFDVACRIQQPPERLGSSYLMGRSCRPASLRADGSCRILCATGHAECEVEVEADNAALLCDQHQGRLTILPSTAGDDRLTLVRWGYVLRWVLPDEHSGKGAAT